MNATRSLATVVLVLVLALAGAAHALEFRRIGQVEDDLGGSVVGVDTSDTGNVFMAIHEDGLHYVVVMSRDNAVGIAGLLETAFAQGRHLPEGGAKGLYSKSPNGSGQLTVMAMRENGELWVVLGIRDGLRGSALFRSPQSLKRVANLLRRASR